MPRTFRLRRPARHRVTGALTSALAAGGTAVLIVLASSAAGWQSASAARPSGIQEVTAEDETAPVAHSGDAADDPAIWVDHGTPGRSVVIGNDKQGALETYDLTGRRLQRIATSADWGNVDIRQGVTVAGRTRDLVAANNGAGMRFFAMSGSSRMLTDITEGGLLSTGVRGGLCLHHAPAGDLYVFAIAGGDLRQYRVTDPDDDGQLSVTQVRQIAVGGKSEGCVVDDARRGLFVSQEKRGIWRYGADPGDGSGRTSVDTVNAAGHLVADVEGLTIATRGGRGYLFASAQSGKQPLASYFTVYDLATLDYVKAVRVVAGGAADGCSKTDGVAAYGGGLGASYPGGLFVCQDDANTAPGGSGRQNFKLVRLEKLVDLG